MCIDSVQILCHLFKGLEHPWISIFRRLGTSPLESPELTVSV